MASIVFNENSGVEHGGIGVGRPGEYTPRNPTQPNDPPGSPSPDIPKPTPTTGQRICSCVRKFCT